MNKLLILAASAAALALPGLANAADASGAWKLATVVGDMTYHTNCSFTETAPALTGTCVAADATPDGSTPKPVPITGSVDGSNVKFSYDVSFGDMQLHLDYAGAMTSDTAMTGKVSVAGMDLDFTGTKG